MSDTVVRHHRRPSAAAAGESVARGALFLVMVAPTAVLWALALHALLRR